MKKMLPSITCILIGLFLGFFLLKQYREKEETNLVSKENNILYFIQIGSYSSFDEMQNSIKDFYNYVYEENNETYYAYVAIVKNKEILEKLKEFFTKSGYVIYIKEKYINNPGFNDVLGQYELLLKETDDSGAIMTICSQIVSKYEELELSD